MQTALLGRLRNFLSFPLRATNIAAAWHRLWSPTFSTRLPTAPFSNAPSANTTAPFASFALHLLSALRLSSSLAETPCDAAPPAGRLTLRAPLVRLLHVPTDPGVEVEGAQLEPQSSPAPSLVTANCTARCTAESRDSAWWPSGLSTDSRWSEVHALGEQQQLAISFLVPLPGGTIAAALPLT